MDSTASSLLAARDPPEAEFVRDLRLQTKRGDLSVYTMLALTGAQATVFRSLRQSKANLPRSTSSVDVGSERQVPATSAAALFPNEEHQEISEVHVVWNEHDRSYIRGAVRPRECIAE